MNELIARLRIMQEPPTVTPDVVCWDVICSTFRQAADEIERLRTERDDAVRRMEEGWIEVCQNVYGAALKGFVADISDAEVLLREARSRAEWYSSRSTHWDGCEVIHPDCAVLKKIDAWLARRSDGKAQEE